MPLSPEQQQELAELRRLDELEAKLGKSSITPQDASGGPPSPAARETPKPGFTDILKGALTHMAGSTAGGLVQASPDPGIRKEQMSQQAEAAAAMAPVLAPEAKLAQAAAGGLSGYVTGGPTGAAVGAALPLGAGAVANKVSKLADWLSQKSVGMRKYVPEMGTRLLDQGVWGTESGMRGAVRQKLPGAEQAVQDAAEGITGKFSTEPFAEAVEAKSSKFITPDSGDSYSPANLDKVQQRASSLREMGAPPSGGESMADAPRELTAKDVLGLKRQADHEAYLASGNKAASLDGSLAGAVGDTARSELNRASGGATANALADERALVLANKSMNRLPTIRQGLPMSMLMGMLSGSTAAGVPGGIAGAAAAGAMRTPLVQSGGAKLLHSAVAPAVRAASQPGATATLSDIMELVKGAQGNGQRDR